VSLITGAASGIGRATAALAGWHGAELFLTDVASGALARAANELRRAGCAVRLAEPADISDLEQVRALGASVHAQVDALDVVMNIAGVSAWGTVENLEHAHWQAMVDVNLMGPIHVIEAFVPPMIAAGRGGHLVNVASAAALVALPWHAACSASKFGAAGSGRRVVAGDADAPRRATGDRVRAPGRALRAAGHVHRHLADPDRPRPLTRSRAHRTAPMRRVHSSTGTTDSGR
jgi:NADP-dependent 3-hydroxy acid dehydrogenase YdfG